MLNRLLTDTEHVYLALGATDFRKQISSLASLVQLQFGMDPFMESSLFLKERMIEKQTTELDQKDQLIEKQRIQIDNLIQALLHARKKIFGASFEKTQIQGQLSLFDSVQELARELLKE